MLTFEEKLRRTAGWVGLLAAATSTVVVGGWIVRTDPQALWPLSVSRITVDAALCLMLAGGSLWCQQRTANWARAGIVCAAAALGLAVLVMAESAPGVNLGLGGFFSVAPAAAGAAQGALMTVPAAVATAALALALLMLRQRRARQRWPVSTGVAYFVVAFGVAGLLALNFGGETELTRPLQFSGHHALGLVILATATLLAQPNDRHVRLLFAATMGGMLARRLFLGVAVMPVAFSAVLAWLVRSEHVTLADGMVLFVVTMILFGFGAALCSAEATAGINEDREQAEQTRLLLTARLQEQAAQLQETVSRRTAELRDANASLRAVAESNALLALVAQNSTNGVVITDGTGCIEWVNGAYTRLTGYALNEVKGRKPGHILQGPDTDPAAVARLREAERHGAPCNVEILNYTKQGAPFWQIVDMQPVHDRSGKVINFVANLTDITGQRADKSRLEHLNRRLQLATRAAALGVWEWDAASQRSVWDERTLEIYGLRADEFKGTFEEWKNRLHPQDRNAAVAQTQSAMAGGDYYEREFRIIRACDGAERHVQSRAIVQHDAQGRLTRITGTERDVTAEREATQHMEALNERLRLALRSSNYGVWEYDIITGRRNWDERVLEIYGLRPDEFDPSSPIWRTALHPDDRAPAEENLRRAIRGEAADYKTEFRVVRPDGSVRYVESHGYVQRDARGKPRRLVGLNRDVTEQRQMAQALDLAEQRWQLAIEGTNDSVWDWDVETGQVYHDDRWSRMLGFEPDEIENSIDGWKALVHADDRAGNEAAIREHFEQHTPFYQHELRMRAKHGAWRWILDRGKVVSRAADGRPLRMAGTHTDINARKELEERLHKSEELASEVSRLAQIGGWEIDWLDSRVTWNDGTRRIHEVDDAFQPTVDSVWQFFPPEALAAVQAALGNARPEAPSFDLEVQLLTARGRRRWVRILGHGGFRNGRAVSVHGAIQDVTAQHESELARRELETQLFQAQKMETLGTLAGGIAHDFNNLLTGIIGYHELAADSLPGDHESRLYLHEARNASLRARELVERILTFGRRSGGGALGPIDLAPVVEEARRFLRATLPANITIEVQCAPHCGLVLADATQIHQVILNLGSNAAHAMRLQGGTLQISLESAEISPDLALTLGGTAADSYVRLSVRDTGHGIDESTRRRIFDPFFTTKNTREGTGLGLAVVHGIVRSHRGAIDVDSTPGNGATFHIYLPNANTRHGENRVACEPAPRGDGEFICVVDDEEVVGSCTRLVLESKGYRSLIFSSAEQCIVEMQSDPMRCAVLVTDQTMPGLQGTQLAATMRKWNPDLPVVIMSGYFSKISPQALDELGQVELLAKPFTSDELAHAVHRALHAPGKKG